MNNGVFYNCSNLTSVNWNAKRCYIGDGIGEDLLFEGTNIQNVIFGNQVEFISNDLCNGLSGLTSISIPSSVKEIGSNAFRGCTGLTSINIPNTVEQVNKCAFYDCTGLTSATIGTSVTYIGVSCFYNCNNLTSVTWNAKNCTSPFYAPNKITNFVFGNQVESIPNSCCAGLSLLTTIAIPSSVKSIGNNAFDGCNGLTRVDISNLAAWCDIDFSVSTANPLFYAHNLYLNGSKVSDLVIPNSVTKIKDYAFYDGDFTSVTIPNSVTEIGNYAFNGSSLTGSLNIPNSVTTIGNYAFCYCTGLTGSQNIPNSVTKIGDSAFYGCTNLTSLSIPSSVTNIGTSAFYNCCRLTSITVSGENPIYDSREDCNAIIRTETNSLIVGCNNTFIPTSVTSIGNGAFINCTGLTEIRVPNSVTNIGQKAFYNCNNLNVLTIGNSVNNIGNSAFYDCRKLRTIRSRITDPTSVTYGTQVFYRVPSSCNIYVPVGSLSLYQSTTPWKSFSNISELDYEEIDSLDVDGDGWVSSADVTLLYNYILNDGNTNFPEGDVDGDGYVTAADITAIYNMMLGL